MATRIFMKLNTIQPPSSAPPPQNNTSIFDKILEQLNEWLALLPNLTHTVVAKFNDAFPPETRPSAWAMAGIGVVLVLICWCFLPCILGCIAGVVRACWNCVKGLVMMVWRMCQKVLRCLCCCCWNDRSRRMMKAPGTDGAMFIPRYDFEIDPQRYFVNLRAGTLRTNY